MRVEKFLCVYKDKLHKAKLMDVGKYNHEIYKVNKNEIILILKQSLLGAFED